MNFWREEPQYIYVIFPNDASGNVAGAYVGISYDVKGRVESHLHTYSTNPLQNELHQLMRENGFAYKVLGKATSYKEAYAEYDWIDFIERKLKARLFNSKKGSHADWLRLYPKGLDTMVEVKHVLKDGTKPDSIAGYMVKATQAVSLYTMINKINGGNNDAGKIRGQGMANP